MNRLESLILANIYNIIKSLRRIRSAYSSVSSFKSHTNSERGEKDKITNETKKRIESKEGGREKS